MRARHTLGGDMFDAIADPKRARRARSIAFSGGIHAVILCIALVFAYLRTQGSSTPPTIDPRVLPPRATVPRSEPSGKPETSRRQRTKPTPRPRPMVEPREVPQVTQTPPAVEVP